MAKYYTTRDGKIKNLNNLAFKITMERFKAGNRDQFLCEDVMNEIAGKVTL